MSGNRPTYPLLIESTSNYAFAIKRSKENKTFDFFRNVSTKFYRELPVEIRDELHNSILHGTCMLSSEPELNAYMHDMGKMHNAKLRCAYQNLSSEYSCADVIDIIDYGCGQGLGIIAFADHLREASVNQQVRRIVLIEPSEMALRRAALHASVLFPNAELVTINKGFDDLLDGDILSDKDTPTMHILSNVLDLAKTEQAPDGYYDLNRFANLISANIKGKNQFVGVEPLFNNEITDKKFPYFWKRVDISIDYKLKCNKGEFVEGENWTCVIVCGEKNKICNDLNESIAITLEKSEDIKSVQLYPQQQQAFDAIYDFVNGNHTIFILQGYAGTGKTTMIKAMLPMLHSMGKQAILMAPTGRAAKVLMTKTGEKASTIHRTIYSVNRLTSVRHDENGELIKMVDYIYKDKEETRKHDLVEFWFGINKDRDTDYNPQNAVYIVDEASMISSHKTTNELFHFGSDVLLDDLLEYAELLKGGKIIFVGDPAQLPPVGDNCSAALNEVYFKDKGIGVISFELTDVVRQAADSAILENAMMLRDLLQTQARNTLSFKRCDNEVEDVLATTLVAKYVEMYIEPTFGDTAIICYSNKMAKGYNDAIRNYYYPGEKSVQVGDILQVVKNYYRIDDASQSRDALYNGDFVRVLDVSSEVETQSAPVWTKPGNKREVISLQFRDITVQSENGDIYKLKIIDSLLNSTNPGLTPNEHTALYINFRLRNPNLPRDKEAQAKMLMEDPYYNALNVKYGYAITGHKSQGGDWDTVFVDYDGRTGLDNDSLRWMYTATTRAKKRLYGVHIPNIQPFDELHFKPITKLNKLATNAQIVGNVGNVDMLSSNASASQKAKCLSVIYALSRIGCKVDKVEQLQYKDRYYIQVADVVERYDCTYNGAGYYTAYNALDASENNKAILDALQSEECYTYQFDYLPSHRVLVDLHAKMRSVCDELGVCITNIVEDFKQYNVVYFLKTTGKYSYIKFYFDKNMFVTYGHPYSDIKEQDVLLNEIITKLS